MAYGRKAFTGAVQKSLKGGIRPSSSALKKITKAVGLGGGGSVSASQAKRMFGAMKEEGMLSGKASGVGAMGFEKAIKAEIQAGKDAIKAEKRKEAHIKMTRTSRIMEEERQAADLAKKQAKGGAPKDAGAKTSAGGGHAPMAGGSGMMRSDRDEGPDTVLSSVGSEKRYRPTEGVVGIPPQKEETQEPPDMFGPDS